MSVDRTHLPTRTYLLAFISIGAAGANVAAAAGHLLLNEPAAAAAHLLLVPVWVLIFSEVIVP